MNRFLQGLMLVAVCANLLGAYMEIIHHRPAFEHTALALFFLILYKLYAES